ncbi:MAG: intermembrane transport protein PqiB [Myxococcota bacterium]
MSESDPGGSGPSSTPAAGEPVVARRRGLSPIWLIPVVVLVVAVSLAYQTIQSRGPSVVVLFDSAEGLVAGKSKVKYRDVEVGSVDDVKFRSVDQVELHLSLHPDVAPYVTEDTAWWVVRPRISGGGISGLETIVSGSYVTFEPGTQGKKRKREYLGLEEPPVPDKNRPGLEVTLQADDLGGLSAGNSVYFRDIDVGEVVHAGLAEDGRSVAVSIVIVEEHAHRVTTASRFWNAGGVDVAIGPSGLEVDAPSLQSIIGGGVAFDSPPGGKPVDAGARFRLHRSRSAVDDSVARHGGLELVLETDTLGGVGLGDPVYFREVPVGAVRSHSLSSDGQRVRIRINIETRYASFVRSNSHFWNASGISADLGLKGLHVHAESLRSLLSGGVAFATPPDPGHRVKAGSVFRLHPEVKDEWLGWKPDFSKKTSDAKGKAPKEERHGLARWFHHLGKSEDEADD